MSGIMKLTGEPKKQPQKMGIAIVDIFSGLCGVIGGQAALAERAMNFFVSAKAPTRLGNRHPNIVPYKVFAVANGYVIIAFGNDR
jgi:crotonobetainyl-CoA:carnitine CoA-transferase CaiB-like acyl-CoA transferase